MSHKEKMQMKAERRERLYQARKAQGLPRDFLPARINWRTGELHEHKREIARRLRQALPNKGNSDVR